MAINLSAIHHQLRSYTSVNEQQTFPEVSFSFPPNKLIFFPFCLFTILKGLANFYMQTWTWKTNEKKLNIITSNIITQPIRRKNQNTWFLHATFLPKTSGLLDKAKKKLRRESFRNETFPVPTFCRGNINFSNINRKYHKGIEAPPSCEREFA